MAELAIETTETTDSEETSRFRSFTVNHPRTAKVVGYAAVTAATLGAIALWRARKQESDSEDSAEDVPFDASSLTA